MFIIEISQRRFFILKFSTTEHSNNNASISQQKEQFS